MGNNTNKSSIRLSNIDSVIKSKSSIFESKDDVVLVWLDKSIDSKKPNFNHTNMNIQCYVDFDSCLNFVTSIDKERIFFVISGSYAEQYIDQIHVVQQIDSIFIYCMNTSKYKKQFFDDDNNKKYSKIINIFDNEDDLIKSIEQEINILHKQLSTFSLYEKQKTTRDLSQESASFLWFQLFKDVLLHMPRTEQAKDEMIEQCQNYYRGNIDELKNILEFVQTYTYEDSIRWYTKQSFIYRLCNKALRTEDIELLYIFRYFIQDLCKCLANEYEYFRLKSIDEPILTLYRGLKLTEEEIDRFQSNIGSLISTNGFLSTTRNYNLALEFAYKNSKRSNNIFPALFIIKADINLDGNIFADISSLSVYPDEQEVLFDIGCAFKLIDVYFNNDDNVWTINMNLTNESRHFIEKYIDMNRHEMEKGNLFLIFGLLLTEMGQYDQAEIYFEKLLLSNTIDDQASLYTNIGQVKFHKALYVEALKYFKTVYDIQIKENSINHIDLARTIHNIGLVYLEQKKYDLALDYHFDVIKIYHQYQPDVQNILLANTNNSIGIIFIYKHEYNLALKYLFRAMDVYEKCLPTIDHPILATNYNSIGLVYYYIKEYKNALDYCLKSLNIREKMLPKTHPDIADSCNNVALIYHHLFEYEKALSLFQRSIGIYENVHNHKMRLPTCFNNIGLLYLDQHNYDQAIEYYLKALNLYNIEANNDIYNEEIQFTLDNIGVAYEMKSDFDRSLDYYNQALNKQSHDLEKFVRIATKIGNIHYKKCDYIKALDFYKQALDKSDHTPMEFLSSILMSIAIIYHRQHQYDMALDMYQRVLSIRKSLSSSVNDLNLAWTFNNIGCLYDDMGDMKRALKYQEKAYEIRRQSLPSTHPDLATSLNNLGRVHQALAHRSGGNRLELEQALLNYKAAFHIRRKSLPPDHPDLAISYYNLALIHIDQNEYEQAFSEIQKALKIQRKKLATNHPDLEQTLQLEKKIYIMLDYRNNPSSYA